MPRVTKSSNIGRHALALALGLALFAPQAFGQTLTLSGSGENTARSEDYLNYTNLLVDSGTWHLHGPLVSDTAMLRGGAKLLLNADTNLGSGLTTIDGATLQAEAASVMLNQQLRLQVGSLIVDGSNMLTLNNIISGGGGINKIGTGELVLRAANTYSAATMIGNGVINVQSNNATSNGVLTFNGTGNGVLRSTTQNIALGNFFVNMASSGTIDTQTDLLINGRIGGNGVLTKNGAGRLRFTGPWINMGNVVLRDGTIDMGTNVELGGGSLIVYKGSLDSDIDQTFYNPVVLNGALNMTSARNWNFAATIAGAGDLDLNSASTTTLSGNNTFTGTINLNNGTLVAANNNALRSGRVVLNSGVFTNSQILNNTLSTIDVKSDSTVRAAYDWSLNGDVSGSGDLTKTGSGVLTLGGSTNAFTGGVFAQQGRVNVIQQYTGLVGVSSAATMQLGTANDDVLADYIDGYLNLGDGNDRLSMSAQNIATVSGSVDGGSGDNTLNIVNPNALYEFALKGSSFINFGVLNLDGPLGVTLNGAASFMPNDLSIDGVVVNSDSFLDLNGSTLTVNRATMFGELVGAGVVNGSLNTHSTVAPSGVPNLNGARAEKTSMGVLHVTGDLNTSAGQWFIHANDSGASDQILVDGVANISGATVVALPQSGNYADRTVYSFLRADQLVGSFDGVVQNTFAFLTASLDTHNNGVDLILERYVAPPVVVPPIVEPPVVVPPPLPPVAEPPVVVPPVVEPPVVVPPVVEPPVVVPPPLPPVVVPPVVVSPPLPPVVEPPVAVPPPLPPVVEPPVVAPPIVEPPVVVPPPLPPVVEPPVVEPPVVVPPVVEPPVVVPPPLPPVVEPPVVVPPVVEPPAVEQPPVLPDVKPAVPPIEMIVPESKPKPEVAPGNLRYDEFSGLTRNQRNMAYALQESEWRNQGELNELLGQVRALQTSEVVNAFDQLTGESYAAIKNAEANALQYVLDLMDQREIEEGVAVWGDALWFETPLERNIDTTPTTSTSHGFMVGLDVGAEHLRGGVFALKGEGDLSANRTENIKSQRTGGGVRGQWSNDVAQVRAVVGYTQSDIDATRTIALGANQTMTTTAATQSKNLGMAMQARYNLVRRNWLLSPIVEASYVSSKLDGFTEQGGPAQLRVNSSTNQQKVVGGGLGVTRNVVLAGSSMRLYIDGKYMRNLDHTNDSIHSSFAPSNIDFEIVGSRRERQWWNTTVGVDVRSKSWTLSAQAQADLFKKTNAYKVNVSATYRFK